MFTDYYVIQLTYHCLKVKAVLYKQYRVHLTSILISVKLQTVY
jgi:hypothetical protein